jgi:nitric-oxide synthase
MTLFRPRRGKAVTASVPRPRAPETDTSEAEDFIREFHAANPEHGDPSGRLEEVRRLVQKNGTYTHTQPELAWAARLAWRNAARCTGRDKWERLRLRDRRHLRRPVDVAAEVMAHLREATNGGKIRSTITVFAPDSPGQRGPRILNSQAIRYAGYADASHTIGDPANVKLTTLARRLGWQPGYGRFDVLPLVVQAGEGTLHHFGVPQDSVLEVPITHPDLPWFAELGLRWYATPMITDMYLDAGGIVYPCAPFNGWYQASSEVGARDLGDEHRYNALPEIARRMGLDTHRLDTFWKDRAVIELATAVQHSYRAAGVMATDHQSETHRFARWTAAEEARGCPVSADWPWVVPPLSGSTTPAFHRTYGNRVTKPGYFRRSEPPY